MLNGYVNYYSFANNKPKLISIYWILRKSLSKTIANKLKLNSVRKVYQKFSIHISYKNPINNKTIDFSRPNLATTPKKFLGVNNFNNPLRIIDWELRSINCFFDSACANCGTTENLQVHHIKHIKTVIVKLNSFDQQMAAINRKQIPLCTGCHRKVHKGEHDGLSLKHLERK